jgi:hypothetical protein
MSEPEILTHSSLQEFKACPRRYYFSQVRKIRPDGETTKPLRMGTVCHKIKELRRRGKTADEALLEGITAYDAVPLGFDPVEWAVERETVYRVMHAHLNYYTEDGLQTIEAEGVFKLPILHPETGGRTPKYVRGGKIDGVVKLPDARTALEETKTTSQDISPGSDYWLRLCIDEQVTSYVWAARQKGFDVQTIIYDVIRKPTIAPKQVPLLDKEGFKIVLDAEGNRVYLPANKKGEPPKPRQAGDKEKGWTLQARVETPQEFGDRLSADIASRPEFYFQRKELTRLEADLREFEHEQWQTQRSISEADRNNRWYRNTSACLKPYRCPYANACFNGFTGVSDQPLPAGYKIVANSHPELEEDGE